MELPMSHRVVVIAMMLLMATAMGSTEAAKIETWNGPNCEGSTTFVFDNVPAGCQTFIDQGSFRVSGINDDTRVSAHNQQFCEAESMVGQFYGPACSTQGATKLRAVYIDHVP